MITKQNSNFLKLIGVFSMLIDHIGAFLYPQHAVLRIIGRIAFPIFAYQVPIGYQMTSNKKSYFKRLLIFGIISQYPYYLLNQNYKLNIFFTFALAILGISALEKSKYWKFFIIAPASLLVDYGIYGVAMILGFYFIKNEWKQVSFWAIITLIYALYFQSIIQFYSFLSIFLIYKFNYFKIKLPKYFFYMFYPLHLLLIYFIKNILLY